jgi:hypothetical protein
LAFVIDSHRDAMGLANARAHSSTNHSNSYKFVFASCHKHLSTGEPKGSADRKI